MIVVIPNKKAKDKMGMNPTLTLCHFFNLSTPVKKTIMPAYAAANIMADMEG